MMKQGMFLLVVVVLMATVASAAGISEGETSPDLGRIKAQVLSQTDIDRYEGYFSHDRTFGDGSVQWVWGAFRLNREREVTFIEINGVVLHDDPTDPRPSLPGNILGEVWNFNLSLWAYDGDREVMWGHTYDNFLEEGEGVSVVLQFADLNQFLGYSPPEGVDPEYLVIEVNGRRAGNYSSARGGFPYWYDFDWGLMAPYRIVDLSTGEVLEIGQVKPISTEPVRDDGHIINMAIEEGLELVDLRPESVAYSSHPLRGYDSSDLLYEESYPAKIFVIKRNGLEDTFCHILGFTGTVKAYRLTEDGTGTEPWPITFYGGKAGGGVSWHRFSLPSGPQSLIVVFYDTAMSGVKFDVDFTEGGKG